VGEGGVVSMGLVLGEFGVGRRRCNVRLWGWDSVV